jgi:hypothetical protein
MFSGGVGWPNEVNHPLDLELAEEEIHLVMMAYPLFEKHRNI